MIEKETNYGDFTEHKEPIHSQRSEDVLLSAIDKIEQLTVEVETLCKLLGQKELEINNLKLQLKLLKGK